jgi:DNA-binding response OmpR family regulator
MLHILLVEDNGSDALLVREAVRRSSVEADVTIAADGVDAFRILHSPRFRPDLIILDISLPKLNGLDVLERYRQESEGVPVIVFTTSANPKERARALELGAKEWVIKPTNLDEYINTIRAAIVRWMGETAANGI